MKLWLLNRMRERFYVYDCTDGLVIRAETEARAREIASGSAGDEGSTVWMNPAKTTCKVLSSKGPEEVIIRDFHAG